MPTIPADRVETLPKIPGRALAFCFALILAAVSMRAIAEESYKLGVALGFTGTGKSYSQEALRGIELAVDEINAMGGLLGKHRIELIVENTRTNAEIAGKVARKLVERDAVRAVIGTYSSASALAIKPILRDARVLHIATVSNSEDITKLEFSPYTFSVVPNTYMMSKALVVGAAGLARQNGWKTYVTVASDYAWGRSNQEIQVSLMTELAPGVKLIGSYWPPLGEKAFNAFIVGTIKLAPDFILASLAGSDNEYWMRDGRDYGLFRRIPSPGALISLVELERDAKLMPRGIYGRTRAPFFAHLDVPMMKAFVDAYRARHDRYPSDWAVMSYDGVHALRQGVEAAGDIDNEGVRAALTGATIETTRGRHTFREIDNQLSVSAYFGRIGDDPVYPFPIYVDLTELKGPDIWRPTAEIRAARAR
ncbi:MAG TPA: ABC transporter substrate-binding protein [Gammaproteobacteria bacterium]